MGEVGAGGKGWSELGSIAGIRWSSDCIGSQTELTFLIWYLARASLTIKR